MKQKFKNLLILGLLWSMINIPSSVIAGQPAWTAEMKSGVLWQKVTPMGALVVSTSAGLTGINTETGAQAWTIESLKNAPEKSYNAIEGSPFISVSGQDGKNFCIVDPFAGKIVFNAMESGLESVTESFFLYSSAKILVIGTSSAGKKTEIVMADMKTGKKLWSKTGAFTFTTAVKDLGNDEVLLTSAFFAMKIKAADGTEIWKTAIDPAMTGMSSLMSMLEGVVADKVSKEELMAQLITTEYQKDIFILAAQKKKESTKVDSKGQKTVTISYNAIFMAFELQTGKHKWQRVVEMPYPLGVSYPCADGLIVSSSTGSNYNMLNYNDGTGMLGKKGGGQNVKGSLAGAAPWTADKLLLVSTSGSNSFVTAINTKTGLPVFEKSAKIKGIVTYTEILPGGILIGSDEEVNLLNTATGDWFMEDAIPGGSGLIVSNEKNVYVFNSEEGFLMRMDVNGTSFSQVNTTPVKFQGKEKATGIEILNGGICVKSEQNLAFIESSGNVKFNKYFAAPGISGLGKALLIANAVRAAYYTAAYTTYSAAFGSASQSIQVKDASSAATKDVTADISRAFGDAAVTGAGYTASYVKMLQHRFKATTETPEYNLIMTAADKSNAQLIQVSKLTGDVMNTIPLGKDKNPVYDVDLLEGKLYYMKDSVKMECYRF